MFAPDELRIKPEIIGFGNLDLTVPHHETGLVYRDHLQPPAVVDTHRRLNTRRRDSVRCFWRAPAALNKMAGSAFVLDQGGSMVGPLPITTFVILLVVGILILVFVPLVIVFSTIRRKYSPDARVIQQGDPAEATITRIWQTGVRVNNRYGVGMELDVRRPGYPPYTAKMQALISILDVSKFQTGAVIPVKVDPNRPERVYLDAVAAKLVT